MVARKSLWDINSFDQWGVKLGKELASSLVPIVADSSANTAQLDPSTAGLVARLRALRGHGQSG
jgi:glucose-6-phosphate isomerase